MKPMMDGDGQWIDKVCGPFLNYSICSTFIMQDSLLMMRVLRQPASLLIRQRSAYRAAATNPYGQILKKKLCKAGINAKYKRTQLLTASADSYLTTPLRPTIAPPTTLPINNRNCGNNPLFLHSSWNWVNVQTFSPVWLAHHNEMSTFTAALLNTGTQTKLTIVHKVFVECRLQCYTVLGWCMYLKDDMTSCTTSNPVPTGIKYITIVNFGDAHPHGYIVAFN